MQYTASLPTLAERRWAAVAHLGGPIGILLSMGLLGFLVPLGVWVVKRDEGPFAAGQSREALNFSLTLLAVHMLFWVFVLFTLGLGLLIALPAFLAMGVAELVFGFIAAARAHEGEAYRYPFTVRML